MLPITSNTAFQDLAHVDGRLLGLGRVYAFGERGCVFKGATPSPPITPQQALPFTDVSVNIDVSSHSSG